MAYLYVLHSLKYNRYYIGSTREIVNRLKTHNSGKVRSTKAYRPWKLIYTEKFETYSDARKRETCLKSGVGRQWLKKNINI